ncbi:PD-(D/E)XK nuclease family protein [Candidatus Microgenomates bacterium]|nr:MAG: PD-(D/E)XK nuclease family protein [Candidatus Microgenomates bacterium]
MKDKYSAIWVSHSSISDFLKCPRAYYLNNVYKDPQSGHKITLVTPSLALGQAVHSVIEALSVLPVEVRFNESLLTSYEAAWEKVHGKLGGFVSESQEELFKARGAEMLRRVMKYPGPLKNKAVKINTDLPHYWLSDEDNIILCGKIDWLEYFSETDSVGILDFKTGKVAEKNDSLQLPIYYLLAKNCQKRPVTKMSYWYIDQNDEPVDVDLPDPQQAEERVLKIAKRIKVQRQLNHFKCEFTDGCRYCKPFERILKGEAELVGVNDFNQDVYVLPTDEGTELESDIL